MELASPKMNSCTTPEEFSDPGFAENDESEKEMLHEPDEISRQETGWI